MALSSMIPSVTPSNALKAHAIISILFSLPVLISGAGGFLEIISDGAVKSAQMKGPIAGVSAHHVRRFVNWYVVQSVGCRSKAVTVQKMVIKINLMMMAGALLALIYSPPVAGGPMVPPPVLAYFSIMCILYCLALQVPKKVLKMMPSLPKIGGSSAPPAKKKATPTPARRTPSRRR